MAATDAKEQAKAAIERLHVKVGAISDSDAWREHLALQARFHNYSPLNIMWMLIQWEDRKAANPDLPDFSQPAAFSTWKGLNRSVRKGEKALSVLAPIIITDRDDLDGEGKPKKKCVGFRLKNRTFDLSQTDGEPLPENPARPTMLEGESDPATWAALVAHAESQGFTVSVEAIGGGINGYCSHDRKVVAVEESNPPAQQAKTLMHEIAHLHLHGENRPEGMGRPEMEVEAESTAFVLASMLGFDTADYSVGYVATWGDRSQEERGAMLKRTTERVVKCARMLVEALAEHSEVLAA